VWPASSTSFAAVSSSALRFAGAETGGALVSGVIDIAAPPAGSADAAVLAARDWSRALAWALNDNGDPVPLDP
jgi:hypothetical protein